MNLDRVAKLIRMLSSSSDGEVLNAARMLNRIGIHAIADRIERPETATRYNQPNRSKLEERIAKLEFVLSLYQAGVGRLRKCKVCLEPFVARRTDAKACSTKCRVRLHRRGV